MKVATTTSVLGRQILLLPVYKRSMQEHQQFHERKNDAYVSSALAQWAKWGDPPPDIQERASREYERLHWYPYTLNEVCGWVSLESSQGQLHVSIYLPTRLGGALPKQITAMAKYFFRCDYRVESVNVPPDGSWTNSDISVYLRKWIISLAANAFPARSRSLDLTSFDTVAQHLDWITLAHSD